MNWILVVFRQAAGLVQYLVPYLASACQYHQHLPSDRAFASAPISAPGTLAYALADPCPTAQVLYGCPLVRWLERQTCDLEAPGSTFLRSMDQLSVHHAGV
jgi:hypothetical protein